MSQLLRALSDLSKRVPWHGEQVLVVITDLPIFPLGVGAKATCFPPFTDHLMALVVEPLEAPLFYLLQLVSRRS